ncbi:MAG: hypothetical protein HC836_15745 [Richelia sp. RM2_1_2]|nr:hypothetical protein [Richelia sp. RM2_1_2]
MLFLTFLSTFFTDILRDKNSKKYSTTKAVALSTTIYLFFAFTIGLYIMYTKQEVDHWLIGEMITFILTLLGFKNFRTSTTTGIDVPSEVKPEDDKKKPKPSVEEGVF